MNKVDIVREYLSFDKPDRLNHLADDFQFTDSVGGPPMDRATWLGMAALVQGAFPDLHYVLEGIWEEGDDVMTMGHMAGTFSNDLDLSPLGIGIIPATGALVRWPSDPNRFTFEGDKILEEHSQATGPDAGLAGFLKALGIAMG